MTSATVHVSDTPVYVSVEDTQIAVTVSGPPGPAGVAIPGPQGPVGPQGPPGTAYLSSQWTFNQTITPPPANGGMRFNATTSAATTSVFISETDRDGLDRTAGLNVAAVGDQILVQSPQGRTLFNITTKTDSGTYRTFGVTVAELSGSRPSASAITTVYFMTAGGGLHSVPAGGTTGQVLKKLSNADYDVGWVTP